ncbi:MAG: hypothetical protein AB7T31_17420 [Gemmatimonadales bacterium]
MSDRVPGPYGEYHAPPPTPREEMWEAIVSRIREEGVLPAEVSAAEVSAEVSSEVSPSDARRERRRWPAARGWLAAAAVLLVGIALGRATAPEPTRTTVGPAPAEPESYGGRPTVTALDFAALEHLGRSESLLAMVRADAREGRVDPSVAPWARNLLMETRLLLDARRGGDTTLDALLAELELVLTQIVGVTEAGADQTRMQTELDLTIGGMDEREVLNRIRAAMPTGMASE